MRSSGKRVVMTFIPNCKMFGSSGCTSWYSSIEDTIAAVDGLVDFIWLEPLNGRRLDIPPERAGEASTVWTVRQAGDLE